MKAIITAVAPTVYQISSLKEFGMGLNKHLDGSYSASMEFNNEDEARKYLTLRAEKYNSEDPCGTDERLNNMYKDIKHGVLSLDAVTAYIETIDEDEE